MGYFLNIICDNLDNLNDVHYVNGIKPTDNERYDYVLNLLTSIGIKNIRRANVDDNAENVNENYYYFLTHIKDIDYFTDTTLMDNQYPFTEHLRGRIRSDSNFTIVLLDEHNVVESLKSVYNKLFLNFNNVIVLNPNDLNSEYINNLRVFNKKTFNIVYDKWSDDYTTYYANLYPAHRDYYRYKIIIGLIRFYNLFHDIRNCVLDEVYENPNENYFYFINSDNFHHHVMEVNTLPLPPKVRECFNRCNNFHIIMLNEHEYENENYIIYLNNLIKNEKLDYRRIYMLNNNSKLDYYKKKHNILYNVFSLDFLVMFISTHMVELGDPNFVPEKNGDFFLCHNRSPKPHRYAFLCMLKKDGILNQMDWSLIMGWYHKQERRHEDENYYSEFFIDNEKDDYKNEIEFFTNIDIKKSKYEENKTWFDDTSDGAQIFWNRVYARKTYEDTYVNITTESCYSPKEIHITEKSMKPFYFYQFPIFLASYNHVKYLKERFKFDLFEDLIDHSYDDEIDNRTRMIKVIKEIKRIYENKDLFKDFYKNNRQRFEDNRKKVFDIYNSKRDVNFFKSLIDLKIENLSFKNIDKKII
jgi:hypothetical protein